MNLRPLLLLVALISCGKSDRNAHRSTDLQIVSRGSEPRHVLRYQVAKGTSQKLDVAVDLAISADDMGGPLPTIVMSLTVDAMDLVPVGTRLRATVVDMVARERDDSRILPNALNGPLDMMKGLVVTATLTPNGRTFGTKVDTGGKQMPDAAKAQLAQLASSVDNLMMPLPDDAIGVGAVWRNSKHIDQGGLSLTAVNSIQVTSIDGDKLSFTIDTMMHGADQTVSQGDATVEIEDIVGTGHGKGTIDLRTLAVTSELSSELRSSMQVPGEGSATAMKMEIETRVSLR